MALNNFKRTDIIVDKIDRSLDEITPLKAQQGEYNGRYLRVQLTNGGIIEPQTADVQFGFRHNDNANNGIVVAKKTDPSKGIYDIYYPTEMTREAGVVICQLKIIETTGSQKKEISLTSDFKVTVARSIITGQMEVAENSITVFDKVLLDIKEHERRVILLETAFGDLYKILNTNIPNMDVKVSSRADQTSVSTIKARTDYYLDASISSRAPANTALSSSVWTNYLATALNNKLKPRVQKRVENYSFSSSTISDVLNVSGAGCLRGLYISSGARNADVQFEIKILIDGRVFFYLGGSYSTSFLLKSEPSANLKNERDLIYPSTSKQTLQYKDGAFSKQAIFTEPIYFKNSLRVQIQHKSDNAGYGYYGSYEIDYEVVV